MIEVPYSMPASAPKRPRAPHPSGYQLAKAKNARMLALINAIEDRLKRFRDGYGPSNVVFDVENLISEWRDNG